MTNERPRGTGYLLSMDGWRAIAVLGVMVAHDRAWTLFGYSSVHYKTYGGHGVSIFFAISGFLITSRILEEERLCERFDIIVFIFAGCSDSAGGAGVSGGGCGGDDGRPG